MKRNKEIKKSKHRTSLNKRIYLKCLDCSGGIPKEVTLCHLFSCPLWAVRFGYPMKNKRYGERMKKAQEKFSKEFKDLADMGIKPSDFFVEHRIAVFPDN